MMMMMTMPLLPPQSINKSLSALGDVISDLSSKKKHIPYRNNKLTMVWLSKSVFTSIECWS